MAASNIRYDDFVSNVQPDPSKPESTIMLSGFVGHGPEGHARVYPDPTLGTWYDIPESDVVHSMPIADSKLGGSFIWVRASSEIKPGSAAAAATPALEAPQQAPHAAAAMMPTPATYCFICPPHAAIAAAPVGGGGGLAPTPATLCLVCPLTVEVGCIFTQQQTMCCPPTPMTACQPVCPPPPPPSPLFTPCCPPTPATNCLICDVAPTPLTRCFVCPPPVNHLPTQPVTLCCTQPVALCGVVAPTILHCSPGCGPGFLAAAGAGFQNQTPATHCLICQPRPTLFAPCTELCVTQHIGCPPIAFTQLLRCGAR